MLWLKEKVAIITGAGSGLGREYALMFASHGAKVIVNDPGCTKEGTGSSQAAHSVVEEIRQAGGQAVPHTDPVGSLPVAQSLVESAIHHFGRLDILVNNAGILRDRTLLNMTEDEWDAVIHVHLKGTFTCLQAAARHMKDHGGGCILNTSSSSGLLGNFGQANYGAAKAGIYGLTRVAANELQKYHINVNAIAPIAATRMLADLPGLSDQDRQQFDPHQVATLATFLASDHAKALTGHTFGLEGNQLFLYRMLTSHGVTQFANQGRWTLESLAAAIPQTLAW